jgi:hypothetical protein
MQEIYALSGIYFSKMMESLTDVSCAIITYPSTYYLGEEQRTEDKRVLISNPEIRTAFGHKFLSQADRISILRRTIFLCTQ